MRLARPLIASASGSGRWTQSASGPSGRLPSTRTGWPGLPTTVEFGGTSWMTTLLAPIFAPWPIVIGPSSFAPEPIVTLSWTGGWRLPVAKPEPPCRGRAWAYSSRVRSFLILHGWQGSGPDHWQTWLARRLADAGEDVRYPDFPEPDFPQVEDWAQTLHAELAECEAECTVLCH